MPGAPRRGRWNRGRTHVWSPVNRSEEHTSELQSQSNLVCRLLLEKKKKKIHNLYIEESTLNILRVIFLLLLHASLDKTGYDLHTHLAVTFNELHDNTMTE